MHPHTRAFAAPVTGTRFNAPWGPSSRRTPVKPCRVRRFTTLDQARFAYWCRTGEIWRHKRPPIMGAANLLTGTEGTFDDGTDNGWTGSSATVAATTDQAYMGTHSLEVTATAATAFEAVSPEFAVSAGTSYLAAAYYRAATTTRIPQTRIVWYTSGHVEISQTAGNNVAETNTDWTRGQTVTGTAPGTAAFGRVLATWASGAVGEIHYIDTVSADTTAPGNPWVYQATGTFRVAEIAVDGFDIIQSFISAWAGGGGGGARSGVGGATPGAGGGGGAFASSLVTQTPGDVDTVTVGQGGNIASNGTDSWYKTTATVLAKAGLGAVNNAPGAGGPSNSSVGTTKFRGGNGSNTANFAGAGGGGAGTTGQGKDASSTTPGGATAIGGGAGGAASTAGSVQGGGGGGAPPVTGTAGVGARGLVTVDPTRFRVQNDIVSEHEISVPRLLVANRTFNVITEHVIARTLNVGVAAFPVVTEHIISQGAKSIVKTAFTVVQEHVPALTRSLIAARSFSVITEHVALLTRTLTLARSFNVITEHVVSSARSLAASRSFNVITEHEVSLSRSLVASRSFNVITEHVAALTRSLVAARSFNVITEHVATFSRQQGLLRSFNVITEHDLSLIRVVTFDRRFFVISEHVVTAAVCMDFDDVPGGACPPCDETDVWGVSG